MPHRPNVPCQHPGCPALIPYGKQYCEKHAPLHTSERESAGKRGYNSRWRRESKAFLAAHPLCVECQKEGRYVQATVVDHIVPHRGDQKLFWDRSNWQPLCEHHHNVKTMTKDRYQEYRY